MCRGITYYGQADPFESYVRARKQNLCILQCSWDSLQEIRMLAVDPLKSVFRHVIPLPFVRTQNGMPLSSSQFSQLTKQIQLEKGIRISCLSSIHSEPKPIY